MQLTSHIDPILAGIAFHANKLAARDVDSRDPNRQQRLTAPVEHAMHAVAELQGHRVTLAARVDSPWHDDSSPWVRAHRVDNGVSVIAPHDHFIVADSVGRHRMTFRNLLTLPDRRDLTPSPAPRTRAFSTLSDPTAHWASTSF